jgi:hypothetical protein
MVNVDKINASLFKTMTSPQSPKALVGKGVARE